MHVSKNRRNERSERSEWCICSSIPPSLFTISNHIQSSSSYSPFISEITSKTIDYFFLTIVILYVILLIFKHTLLFNLYILYTFSFETFKNKFLKIAMANAAIGGQHAPPGRGPPPRQAGPPPARGHAPPPARGHAPPPARGHGK